MIEIDSTRKSLLLEERHLLVLGGPGSGKTTIALLKAAQEVSSRPIRSNQRVLFLSFARATVARVAQHAQQLVDPRVLRQFEINTYHGFAWTLLRSHGYLIHSGRPLRLLPPPQAAARLAEVHKDDREEAKRRLLKDEGLLHFDLFAGLAAELLSRSQKLRGIVCKRYPYIVLDEFQDTNEDEWRLIKELGRGSHLLTLADAEQRIYEFRGADPRRIGEFIGAFDPAQFDLGTQNNRSNGTDIVEFGNDLLAGKVAGKSYENVNVKRYRFYAGKSQYFALKAALLQALDRQIGSGNEGWSIAILVPSRRTMLDVSDYLSAEGDGLKPIKHEVALETEGPALAAQSIAQLLECASLTPDTLSKVTLECLCDHIRGRKGGRGVTKGESSLLSALDTFQSTGKITGPKRKMIVDECMRIAKERFTMHLTGDPATDWAQIRGLFESSSVAEIKLMGEEARYLRLMHKGAALRSRLDELWRYSRSYIGASSAIHDALLQEHFSSSLKVWRGVQVMTIHKSKGKEFSEVILFEGMYQGRFVGPKMSGRDKGQAMLALRVGVTRAIQRVTILTPQSPASEFL